MTRIETTADGAAEKTHRVRIFAAARETLGVNELAVPLRPAATVADLRQALCERYPEIARIVGHSAISLDDQYAADAAPIDVDRQIALIPPVSGG